MAIRICSIVTVPVVFQGCDSRSFLFKEGHGLRVFESRVLRKEGRINGRLEKTA
jgi:hypothetical protein